VEARFRVCSARSATSRSGWAGSSGGATADVEAIETPIGFLPLYEDLEKLFRELIDKDYPRELYDMQFSLYVDKILARIELQHEAYGKEENLPARSSRSTPSSGPVSKPSRRSSDPVVTPEQLGGCQITQPWGDPSTRAEALAQDDRGGVSLGANESASESQSLPRAMWMPTSAAMVMAI
jgi:hypothetical protein